MRNAFRISQSEANMRLNIQLNPKLSDRTWLSSISLVLLVGAAAFGVLSGISPEIMIAGEALVLIVWELTWQIVCRRKDNIFPLHIFPKWAHIRLLVTSVGIGLLLAEGGLYVQISLPFGIVILEAFLILFSFYRFYRMIIK